MEQEPYLQVGVKVLLKNPEGKYLFLRRSPLKYPEAALTWDIVGGRIDIGTPLLANLKREVFEETKLTLVDIPHLVGAQDILNIERYPGRHVVRLTYIGAISGTPVIDEESFEWKWMTGDEIRALPTGALDMFFKALLDEGTVAL